LAARFAARHNPGMCDKYTAMIILDKLQKVTLTAIMRRLIETANAFAKADRVQVSKGN
jgi:hypothetical protein